jgi:hypothetical protein
MAAQGEEVVVEPSPLQPEDRRPSSGARRCGLDADCSGRLDALVSTICRGPSGAAVNGYQQRMVAMILTDPKIFENLLTRLGGDPLARDVAVVSVAAHGDGAGGWSLQYGSVLLGPAEMAASSWLDWRAAYTGDFQETGSVTCRDLGRATC